MSVIIETEEICQHFGGRAKLARILGISTQAVHQWGESIPPWAAIEIERISEGKFRATQMAIKKKKSAAA